MTRSDLTIAQNLYERLDMLKEMQRLLQTTGTNLYIRVRDREVTMDYSEANSLLIEEQQKCFNQLHEIGMNL